MSTTTVTQLVDPRQPKKRKLLETLADRYGVEPDIFQQTVSAVAMPQPHTREELISCLIVANEHNLNPLTKEIHFMRTKQGAIQPIVGVDGWVKKMNEHPQFDGFELEYEWGGKEGKDLVAATAKIYRKDRKHPIIITELMSECRRPGKEGKPNAWDMTPARMLRHRALMQGVRYAIGFAGVMDYDEFERWQENQDGMRDVTPQLPMELPDDILPLPWTVPEAQVVSEAEASQDAPFPNPQQYVEHLEDNLAAMAEESEDSFDQAWIEHLDTADGRLSREWQAKAEAAHALVKKRFGFGLPQPTTKQKKGKKEGESGGSLI
jgi:phage recombination protein Bet